MSTSFTPTRMNVFDGGVAITTAARTTRRAGRFRAVLLLSAAAALVAASIVPAASARAEGSPADPSDPTTPATVTADLLPTPQIGDGTVAARNDMVAGGVVWDQVVVGTTVFVAGAFTKARPSGAGAGEKIVSRTHMLSYDVTTGALLAFAPTFNAPVRALAVSADGKKLYVGGDFTTVNGVARSRIAAFDVATGKLDASFAPVVNKSVMTLATSGSALYAGGSFTTAQKTTRSRAAAFSTATGAVLPWDPAPVGGDVKAVVVAGAGSRVVIGGSFETVRGGTESLGMASVSPDTGSVQPWAVGTVVRNGEDQKSGIYSLAVAGDSVYGTGWAYGTGNFEGTFKARAADGSIEWLEDCRGDAYSVQPVGDVVYTAGHHHDCGNVGGFGDYVAPEGQYRGLAFSDAANGTNTAATTTFWSHAGQPAPSLLHWFPAFDTGLFTGSNQGPWDVTSGNGYVLYGGEFRSVNGIKQNGLARFAAPSAAPDKNGPRLSGAKLVVTAEAFEGNGVRLSWTANDDRDSSRLRYQVIRDGNTAKPVFETDWIESTFWITPTVRALDVGLVAGKTYSYRVKTIDPDGNSTLSAAVSYTAEAGTTGSMTDYDRLVLRDGPSSYWPLNETAGATAFDWSGSNDLSTVPGRVDGIEDESGGRAGAFDGTAQFAAQEKPVTAPVTYSAEAWFATTSTRGGQIMGFGHARDATNSTHDRHVYLTDAGRIVFGVWTDSAQTLTSPSAYNDGRWHHVVTTLGPSGLQLFVDGERVASRAEDTPAGVFEGYWNIAGNTIAGWPSAPTSDFLDGAIDNVALYDRVLSAATVASHADAAPQPEPEPTPSTVASDRFERSMPTGWGSAETGGAWSVTGTTDGVSVDAGAGNIRLAPSQQRVLTLPAVAETGSDTTMTFSLDRSAGTSSHYVSLIGRGVGSERYTARVIVEASKTRLDIQASGKTLASVTVASVGYVAGQEITVRFQVVGTGSTTLRAKAWFGGGAEPTTWQIDRTDTSAGLQKAGTVGMIYYAGRPDTTTFSVSDFSVVRLP